MSNSSFRHQEDQQFVSPVRMYKRLTELVINETNSEELLVYEKYVVDYMNKQCDHLITQLAAASGRFESFVIESHKMELQRITYLVHKYFERRIHKIENNASHLIKLLKENQDQEINLLSLDEIHYLKNYVQGVDRYLFDVVLQNFSSDLPQIIRSFNLADLKQDELKEHAEYKFVRALKNCSIVVNDPQKGEQVVELKEKEQYFLPYSSIKPHLLTNQNLLLI